MTDAIVADNGLSIAGLRELADFLEAHPVVRPQAQTYNVYVDTRDELAAIARLATWQKVYVGDYFVLRKTFADGTRLDVYTDRENVCRAVVTGTRVVAAVAAVPEHEEPIVEWVCDHESLLSPEGK